MTRDNNNNVTTPLVVGMGGGGCRYTRVRRTYIIDMYLITRVARALRLFSTAARATKTPSFVRIKGATIFHNRNRKKKNKKKEKKLYSHPLIIL